MTQNFGVFTVEFLDGYATLCAIDARSYETEIIISTQNGARDLVKAAHAIESDLFWRNAPMESINPPPTGG
jgi:hypothetical protein